jgi:hypothetical protein
MLMKALGSLQIWLAKGVCWLGGASGKRGDCPKYSETGIQFCLTVRGFCNLALFQAMAWRKARSRL